jgi:hypothetical protein
MRISVENSTNCIATATLEIQNNWFAHSLSWYAHNVIFIKKIIIIYITELLEMFFW